MKTALLFLTTALGTVPLHAENKATAQWIPESTTATSGKPYRTVVRLTVDEDWHTYWENPGEGGLPLKITAEMPAGWTLGPIQFPAPKAFMTGDLHGFGYEGEILFPITITPPADLKNETAPPAITATLSWLTCDDSACLPGKAELTLSPPDPDLVEKACAALPKPIPGAKLSVSGEGEKISAILTIPEGNPADPATCQVFTANRNIIDPAAKPLFLYSSSEPRTWHFSAPKSEYFTALPENTTLILLTPEGQPWKISTAPPAGD